MAKYLLLKHYRGGRSAIPTAACRWTSGRPRRSTAHIAFMDHVADILRERGEFVDAPGALPGGHLRAVRRRGHARR